MYSRDDLHVITSPFPAIRARPAMYAPGSGSPIGLAYLLGADALAFGARSVRTDVVSGWYLVSADIDWLSHPYQPDLAPSDLFGRMVHSVALGPNSIRGEVVVAALARAGFIAVPSAHSRAFGDVDPSPEVVGACCPYGYVRTVAFLPQHS